MTKLKTTLLRTVTLAALIGSMGFTLPAHAQASDDMSQPAATDQAAPADNTAMQAQPAATPGKHMMHGMDKVEARIKTLHDKLKITPAEETDWATVAQTMRDNEADLDQLIQARHANPDNMTAIDDLQSYQKIMQAHADGLAKMTTAFQTLYNDMSDAQKKNADEVFGKFEGHRGGKGKMHHHAM